MLCFDFARFDRYDRYGFTMDDSDKFFLSLPKLIRPDNNISIDNVIAKQFLDKLGGNIETLMKQVKRNDCSNDFSNEFCVSKESSDNKKNP